MGDWLDRLERLNKERTQGGWCPEETEEYGQIEGVGYFNKRANMEFIAAAANHMDALLKAARENERLRNSFDKLNRDTLQLQLELQEENARLRKLLVECREQFALMAEGEGSDETVYMQMSAAMLEKLKAEGVGDE